MAGGLFENLLGEGAEFLGTTALQNTLGDLASEVGTESRAIGARAREDTTFKPFSVTSGVGGATAGATGGLDINLSPEQAARQAKLLSQSGGFFDSAARTTADREADIFERIRATQRPGEERSALSLENRLLAQGRTGVRTDAFGGTPEQLAAAKAVAEARNTASLSAITQSQAEQAQNADLGGLFQTAGFAPDEHLLNLFDSGLGAADIAATGQREGANLGAQADLGGLVQETNFAKLIADLQAGKLNSLAGVAGNVGAGIDAGVSDAGGLLALLGLG